VARPTPIRRDPPTRYDEPVSTEDPFPRDRLGTLAGRIPAYLRLTWHLGRDPMISRARRAALIAAAGYVASPVDLVPGVIPVVGQLDDLAVALTAIRLALAGLSPERRRLHLDAVGLTDDHLADDLRTLAATAAWVGRAATHEAVRAGGAAVRLGRAGSERLVGSARQVTRATADRLSPRATNTVDRARGAFIGVRARLPRRRGQQPGDPRND
jgi:uncharacterized membrane protein YkvA (DUF1232 family)